MKDIKHIPEITEDSCKCSECGADLPVDIAIQSTDGFIYAVGDSFLPFSDLSIPCTSAAAKREAELAAKVKEITIEEVVLKDGEEVKKASPGAKTEREKIAARAAYNNFWAMRDATKPRQ